MQDEFLLKVYETYVESNNRNSSLENTVSIILKIHLYYNRDYSLVELCRRALCIKPTNGLVQLKYC